MKSRLRVGAGVARHEFSDNCENSVEMTREMRQNSPSTKFLLRASYAEFCALIWALFQEKSFCERLPFPRDQGFARCPGPVPCAPGAQGLTFNGYGGVGPIGRISATSVTFTSRPVGSMSTAQTITLANTGDEAFFPTVSAISGTNASEFSVSNSCSGTSLAAGSNCVISVSFNPTTAGSKSASLQIGGSASTGTVGGLPVTFAVSGSAF